MWIRRIGCNLRASVKSWFAGLSSLRKVFVIVLLTHGIFVLVLIGDHVISFHPKKQSRLLVRTLSSEKTQALKSSPAKVNNRIVTGKTTTPSQPKKTELKQKPAQGKATDPKKAQPAPIVQKKPPKEELFIPAPLRQEPEVKLARQEAAPGKTSLSYEVALALALQEQLQLPEMGEVLIKLTLQTPGILVRLDITDSKNLANSEFLKKQLPLVELPCFNDYGIATSTLQVTISFQNAEHF